MTMPKRRQHWVEERPGSAHIAIEEPFGGVARWSAYLDAKHTGKDVEISIIGRLVVRLTPEEARDFAAALMRVARGS